jgi:Arc/MetJ-type ribon-helix-helix transcriptional regulator
MSDNPNNPNQTAVAPAPQPEGGRSNDPADFNLADILRDLVNKVPETVNKAVERALNVKDTTVLIRLNDHASDSLDKLVTAGVFKSRTEAAAFLIDEGVKAQSALFQRIEERMSEIERLREELRQSVSPDK